MSIATYLERRGELETYFDRTAVDAWAKLTSDAPVGRIRATVRAGRDEMRITLLSWLPQNMSGARLLDAGCGPLRSGVHFINYLDRNHYCGIDINPDFIRVAKETAAQDPVLHNKSPKLEHVENFNFPCLDSTFSYVLAFSVLNHCDVPMRRAFFEKISQVISPQSQIYLTHGHWWQDSLLSHLPLTLKRSIVPCALGNETITLEARLEANRFGALRKDCFNSLTSS